MEDLGRVREELGAERVRREQAERERDELRARLQSLQGPDTDAGLPEGSTRSGGVNPQADAVEPVEAPDGPERDAEASEGAESPGPTR